MNTRAIEDDADPAATIHRRAHLTDEVQQEQHGTIGNPWQAGTETAIKAFLGVLLTHFLFDLLPFNKAKTQFAEAPEPTKTRKSVRDVKLLPPALKALGRQKQITFFLKGGHIFRDPRTNEPWAGDEGIRQGPWKFALRKAGVRYRRPYQTRHTYASMMLTAGEPLGWVAGQMGHSDLNMLGRVYARWIKSATPDVGSKAVAMFAASCDQNCDQAGSIDDISGSQSGHKKTITR